MKYVIILILFPIFSSAQNGPSKIREFEVGVTTVDFVRTLYKYSGLTGYGSAITNDEEMEEAYTSADDSDFVESDMKEINPLYTNKKFSRPELVYTTDSNTTFFIRQIEVAEGIPVNNLVLYFFRDTLVKISYDMSEKAAKIFIDKYKNKGYNKKTKTEISNCTIKTKTGQRFKNSYTTYDFRDIDSHTFSTIKLSSVVNSSCHFIQYYTVEIFDGRNANTWLDSVIRNIKVKQELIKKAKEVQKEILKSNF